MGGRITACTLVAADGRSVPVLHPFPENHTDLDHWAKGGLYPLVPYSGRIRDARLRFADRDWPLAPYDGSPHTLHGIAQRRPWTLEAHSATQARLRYAHSPDPHWPWAFEATLDVALALGRMTIGIALRNTGTQAMPGGIGLHPYFIHQPADTVAFEAGKAWPFDADFLARRPPMVACVARPQQLDASAFMAGEVTRFHAGWSGTMDILSGESGHERLRIEASGALTQLVIHRPAQAPYLCIEPVSHVADGFNLQAQGVAGTGTQALAPGESMQGSLAITLGSAA